MIEVQLVQKVFSHYSRVLVTQTKVYVFSREDTLLCAQWKEWGLEPFPGYSQLGYLDQAQLVRTRLCNSGLRRSLGDARKEEPGGEVESSKLSVSENDILSYVLFIGRKVPS